MSGVAKRLTAADHQIIEQLVGEGLNAHAIGKRIEKHPSTVQWFMYSSGLQAPKQTTTPKVYVRNGRQVRGFSIDEDAYVVELRKLGKFPREIAIHVNARFANQRSHHTIHCRLKMLAGVEETEP